ncbi:hypothetical protein [uncultured Piscinibacter sp.]|uniref:hypothetical protein n=1 Tax=uncultured Piscinibacter sp. TaxID=1131835 RepID=UPI0026171426|nr:hypothetical protein [uncultured Piscinibacter sp.]
MDVFARRLAAAFGSIKLRIMLSAIAAMAAGVLLTAMVLVERAERDTLENHRERQLATVVNTAAEVSTRPR